MSPQACAYSAGTSLTASSHPELKQHLFSLSTLASCPSSPHAFSAPGGNPPDLRRATLLIEKTRHYFHCLEALSAGLQDRPALKQCLSIVCGVSNQDCLQLPPLHIGRFPPSSFFYFYFFGAEDRTQGLALSQAWALPLSKFPTPLLPLNGIFYSFLSSNTHLDSLRIRHQYEHQVCRVQGSLVFWNPQIMLNLKVYIWKTVPKINSINMFFILFYQHIVGLIFHLYLALGFLFSLILFSS